MVCITSIAMTLSSDETTSSAVDIFTKIQSIATVVAAVAIFVAIYQIILTRRIWRTDCRRKASEKAIDMALIFANELISNSMFITGIYTTIGIYNILDNCKDIDKIRDFSSREMYTILGAEKIRDIERRMKTITAEVVTRVAMRTVAKKVTLSQVTGVATPEELARKRSFEESMSLATFSNTHDDLLNKLEWFCMHFKTGVADEETVYQSLHQSFLSTVKCLYYDIAHLNVTVSNKYYTNIISVYNSWNDKYLKAKQEEDNGNDAVRDKVINQPRKIYGGKK